MTFPWPRLWPNNKQQARRRPVNTKPRPAVEPLEFRCLLDAGLVRSIDGTGNNLAHPEWGSTDEQLLRIAPAQYGDGISTPAGADRPSARDVSNALSTHNAEDTSNDRQLTAYLYVWGQFLDHDLDLTGSASPTQPFNVSVPAGDPSFDPNNTGTQVIPLNRSIYDPATGTSTSNPRQQINQVTAWIDGSMIYGSDATRAAALRTFSGGKLKVLSSSVGDLLPLNTAGLANANDAHRVSADQLFLGGDVRANENVELTAMQTLFLREHNRVADQIQKANPGLSDEEIYQRARAWVIGEIQVITYKQWLPALLGSNALAPYRGYNPNVNPGIANEFSTAAFRLHTTINDDVEFFDNNGRPISFSYVNENGQTVNVDGEVSLSDAFFNPNLFKFSGVDGMLKYAASTKAEEMDTQLVDSLRNFLFGQPGQGGLDLAALNVQRGRDHGLADYNTTRAAYGLPRVRSFAEITSDVELQQSLKQTYGDVNHIDLWVGTTAEDHVAGSSTGPLMRRILADQFMRLRDGDRFWYQRVFSGQQLAQLEQTTLADVIERNTGVRGLQDNVFFFKAQVQGQVFLDANGNGRQDRNEGAVSGVQVDLLKEGEAVATTRTDRQGRYSFRDFPETGDYQVRVTLPAALLATTANPRDVLISSGDVSVQNVNFGVRPASGTGGWHSSATSGTSADAATTASTTQRSTSTASRTDTQAADDFFGSLDVATILSVLERSDRAR
jgi:peroxidase